MLFPVLAFLRWRRRLFSSDIVSWHTEGVACRRLESDYVSHR